MAEDETVLTSSARDQREIASFYRSHLHAKPPTDIGEAMAQFKFNLAIV